MTIGGSDKNINGTLRTVIITDTFSSVQPGGTFEIPLGADGFKVRWKGSDDPYEAIRASQCSFSMFIEDQSTMDDVEEILLDKITKYYVIIYTGGEGGPMFWWGYLNRDFPSINNEYFPQEVKFEADDALTISKDQYVWEESHVSAFSSAMVDFKVRVFVDQYKLFMRKVNRYVVNQTVYNHNIKFGMNPHTSLYQVIPSFVEAIFSCLFESDPDVDGELYVMEHWDEVKGVPASPIRGMGGLYANVHMFIDQLIYADYPINNEINSISLFEIIKKLCEALNFRIFQWKGRYYCVQTEVYQFSVGCKFGYYVKDPVITNYQPKTSSTGTLTDGNITLVNQSFQGKPTVAGGSFSYLPALKKIEVNFKSTSVAGAPSRLYEYMSSAENLPQVNDLPKKETKNIPSSGVMEVCDFGFMVVDSGALRTAIFQRLDHVSNMSGLSNVCLIAANRDCRHDHTRTMECKIIDKALAPYELYQKYTYDGDDWIWTEISYNAELDEWEGNFVAMQGATEVNYPAEYYRLEINAG